MKRLPARTASTASLNAGPRGRLADPFEAEESGMALVGVEHLGGDAERPQGTHAADAEDDLLPQPVLFVAAVEPVGDRDRLGWIARNVRVEQVQRDPPDIDPPHAHGDVDIGERDRDLHPGRLQAERVGVDAFVALLLPALAVELLVEVALRVQQSDTDQGDAEIRGRLQVVAGEHPEAARVLGERFGDAELR